MKFKIFTPTFLFAVAVLATGCEQHALASEYKQNVAALTAECEKLSEETGEQHDPLVGKVLESKTVSRIVSSKEGSVLNHKMFFLSPGDQIEVSYSIPANYENRLLKESILKSNGIQLGADTEADFGVCGFKNNINKYKINLAHLRFIGVPK